jgi:hypothetical protein
MSNLQPVFTNRTPSPANYRSCTRCRRRSYNLPRPSLLHSRLEAVVHERQLPPPPHPSFGICWHSVVQARRSSARPASPRPRSLAPTVYISMPVCLRGGACPGSVPAPPALLPPPPLSVAAAPCGVPDETDRGPRGQGAASAGLQRRSMSDDKSVKCQVVFSRKMERVSIVSESVCADHPRAREQTLPKTRAHGCALTPDTLGAPRDDKTTYGPPVTNLPVAGARVSAPAGVPGRTGPTRGTCVCAAVLT